MYRTLVAAADNISVARARLRGMPDTLDRRQLGRATLARQLLLEREKLPAVEAVVRLAALQAQEPRPPFLGLWTRLVDFRREELASALHDRSVVRATAFRGTLHLLSAADYATFRATLQPMLTEGLRALGARAAGLDLAALVPVARELLAAGPLDFTALRALLQERFPEVNDRALGYAVRMGLPLVMVPTHDRWAFPSAARFTPADTWLDSPLWTDEVREELVLRYLAAYGPASAADAQAWSGLKGLRAVLDGLRPRLAVFRDERGRELFDLPDAPRPDAATPAPARLLPEFDNLVLAHADRSRLLADEHRALVVTKNLRVRATFLWDGVVAGTWDVTRTAKAATLRLTPFQPLPAGSLDELVAEAEALLRFAEESPGSVTVS
jgi:Winged helix DNA-binding domain